MAMPYFANDSFYLLHFKSKENYTGFVDFVPLTDLAYERRRGSKAGTKVLSSKSPPEQKSHSEIGSDSLNMDSKDSMTT